MEGAVTHQCSLPKCDKSHGSEGNRRCLAHSLVVQMRKQAQRGEGLAQAHIAGPCGSGPRVPGHSPTLPCCRDPEEIQTGGSTPMGWGGSQGRDRAARCSGAFGVGLGVRHNLWHFLGPRESLLVVAVGTGWELGLREASPGGGEAEEVGWRGREGRLGHGAWHCLFIGLGAPGPGMLPCHIWVLRLLTYIHASWSQPLVRAPFPTSTLPSLDLLRCPPYHLPQPSSKRVNVDLGPAPNVLIGWCSGCAIPKSFNHHCWSLQPSPYTEPLLPLPYFPSPPGGCQPQRCLLSVTKRLKP